MSIDTILDRLLVCNAEVTGVTTALRLQPTKPIVPASLPLAYVRPMGMPVEIPGRSAGRYIVTRRFMIVCMVKLSQGATLDYGEEGSALLTAVMPLLDAFADYYMDHPRLGTVGTHQTKLADLTLDADVRHIDAGPEIFRGTDGQEYAGVRPILTIAEIRSANRLS